MEMRYIIAVAAGVVCFIAIGVTAFYVGELVNAPMGVYVAHDDPLDDR